MDYLNSSEMHSNATLQIYAVNFVEKSPLREFEIWQYVSVRSPQPGVLKKERKEKP